jgi:hypothetical protein
MLLLSAAMAALAVVCIGALIFDDRVLLGAPLWLKPLKFAVSLAVYAFTLSWMLSLPQRAHRWTWSLATLIAVIMFVDVGVVTIQAARGTLSHFNNADYPLNQVMQTMFVLSIPVMFLANVVIAVILSFQRLGDRATTWAIRRAQVLDAAGHVVPVGGGHSVGVPDGGPGVPLTAWSTTGGDLRIPHFVGMHGIQMMLLVALALAHLVANERVRLRLVLLAAAGYAGLVALVTWQALRGEPLIHPSATTLLTLAALVGVVAATGWGVLRSASARTAAALR